MAQVTVWDGAECVGGNKILLQAEHLTLWLDFGLNMSRYSAYYEEYLKPQKARGLYELFALELLPPVQGIYDESRFLTDYRFTDWKARLDNVDGVLLSHAHADHAGDLQYLKADIPVLCSQESALLLRALQDCNSNDDGSIYVRQFTMRGGEFTKVAWGRPPKGTVATFRQVFVDTDPNTIRPFWNRLPEERHHQCVLHEVQAHAGKIQGWAVRFLPVDHSIPGAGAWAIETEAGWVVYTGDLRFRGQRHQMTQRFIEEAARLKPRALIVEGTRISRRKSGYTEDTVAEHFDRLLKQHRGKPLFVNFSTTHLERLARFWNCARQNGRRIVVQSKDLYLLHAWNQGRGDLPLQDGTLCWYRGVSKEKQPSEAWEKLLASEYDALCLTAQEISQQPGEYLLCFGYFDLNELPYLNPSGGMWIHSSSEPMSEEQLLDERRLNRWLERFSIERYPPPGRNDEAVEPLHVSGHASREELIELVERIRPEVLIPVHTTEPQQFIELFSKQCHVVIPKRGEAIVL